MIKSKASAIFTFLLNFIEAIIGEIRTIYNIAAGCKIEETCV